MKSRYMKIFRWVLLMIITVVLVRFIITHQDDFYFISHLRMEFLVIILIFNLLCVLFSNLHFYLILRLVASKVPFIVSLKYFTVGRFLNKIVPYSGGVYRAVLFKKAENVSYKKSISVILCFTWMQLLMSLFIGIIIIGSVDPAMRINGVNVLLVLILFFALGVLVVPFFSWLSRSKILNLSILSQKYEKISSQITETVHITSSVLKNKKLFFFSSLIIAFNFLLNLIALHFCFKSINITAGFTVLAVYLIVFKTGMVFKLTPGNIGVNEFLFGFLSESMGFGMAEGITISMIWRITVYLVEGLFSVVVLLTLKDKYEKKN